MLAELCIRLPIHVITCQTGTQFTQLNTVKFLDQNYVYISTPTTF